MNIYFIRHRPTGKFMPLKISKHSTRGWSCWVPSNEPLPYGDGTAGYKPDIPRPFFSRGAAEKALKAWLKGMFISQHGYENDTLILVAPPIERRREDMEIIEYSLVETGQCNAS